MRTVEIEYLFSAALIRVISYLVSFVIYPFLIFIHALPYKTLGKKTYYSEEDVLTFLSNHIKDFKKEDIAFYKARIL